jgi:hypothetical protein
MLLAFLLCGGRRLRLVLLGGCQGLWVLIILFLLASYWKVEYRIAMPAAFGLGIIVFDLVLEAARERAQSNQRMAPAWMPRWIWAACIVAVLICYGWASFRMASRNWALSDFNRRSQTAFRSLVQTVIDRYVDKDPDAIFFNWGSAFPFQFTPPFDTNRQISRLQIVPLGWNQLSPLFDQRLRSLEITDLPRAMYANPHVYFFMPPTRIEVLERFVKEHYQQDVVPKLVDRLGVGDGNRLIRSDLDVYVVQMTTRANSTKPH